jgi:RNA polymerase sigma-70 factor, ECF subfamily
MIPKIMEFCPYISGIDNDRRVWSSNVEMLPAPDISDDDLTFRLRAGDEDAFTFVFRRWQGPIFRFALHMSGNRTLAEDATQEVFMTLIRQTAQFDSAKGKLGAFLFGIARNQVLKRLERERPYTSLAPNWEEASDSRAESAMQSKGAAQPDAEVRAEVIEQVRYAILTLPPDYREVVALCDLEEMSYDEAAVALGCAAGTVASRLHRGRALLATKLRKAGMPHADKSASCADVRKKGFVANGTERSAISSATRNLLSPMTAKFQAQKAPK